MSKLAVVGGGAAGFFTAINAKELAPDLEVTIFERQRKMLAKVEISGGGRCNCTNTFDGVGDLSAVYPRGARLLGRLFRQFGPADAFRWFENHGVPLTVQDDGCVFPAAQDSHAIIDCFLSEARRLGVRIRCGEKVDDPAALLADYDFVAVTIGGTPHAPGCVPSLFSFTIRDAALNALMGTVCPHALAAIPGTPFRAKGELLITHWGMSGPAILRLSSHAARHLAECGYQSPMLVNWTGMTDLDEVRRQLAALFAANAQKRVASLHPFGLQTRLWTFLADKLRLSERRCGEVGAKNLNRLADLLTNDIYRIEGRAPFRDEFVTCGGVPLSSVHPSTLESKSHPNLFYAGEVLDIDGVTGGFNFQAAWSTAHTVAKCVAQRTQTGQF